MATEQANITKTIVQIEDQVARAAEQAMAMASSEKNQRAQSVKLKLGRPIMRQQTSIEAPQTSMQNW